MPVTTRDSIFCEDAKILKHHHYPDGQHIMRLLAPRCAAHAQAGQFVHIQCDPALLLRRPLSIMRCNAAENWIDLLYKDVGQGTHLLGSRVVDESINILGPIGNTFKLSSQRPIRILIGGGVGIPPMIFLAETIASQLTDEINDALVIMGSEVPFPFELKDSSRRIDGIEQQVDATISDLESLGITSRLASLQGYTGCHHGYAPELAQQYLQTLSAQQLARSEIFSCGPLPMLSAVKKLAKTMDIPCQVSLEETMACAVGGCAGCTVEVNLPHGNAMKRVCVDGPVFDAETVIL